MVGCVASRIGAMGKVNMISGTRESGRSGVELVGKYAVSNPAESEDRITKE